jgi:alcohol dehydrogenase
MTALDLLENLDASTGPVSLTTEQTQVLFGPGMSKRLGELARELNGRRVLLVTDQGLAQAGHEQHAVESLRAAGLEVIVFDEVRHDPTTEDVANGLAVARDSHIDLIVGLGGGSSMDCAKGINFLLTNGGQMEDYWGYGKASQPMLPLIAIPTTAGTGSEAQSFALIANSKTHMKMACGDPKAAPRIAILDPELTLTMPASVSAATGIDAISHALEAHVTTKRSALSQRFSRRAWQLLSRAFPAVIRKEQPTHSDRAALLSDGGAMLLGAHFAGAAIENSMLGAAHALANPLSAHFGLTHGVAIGLMLPHVIRFNASAVKGLYGELAADAALCAADDPSAGEKLANRVAELAEMVDLPSSLSACGVDRTMLPVLAEEAASQWTARFNPRPVDVLSLQELYECAM